MLDINVSVYFPILFLVFLPLNLQTIYFKFIAINFGITTTKVCSVIVRPVVYYGVRMSNDILLDKDSMVESNF